MHQFDIPFKQGKANLLQLLGGDNPAFTGAISRVTLVGVKDADGEEMETSHIGFKGTKFKREASGYTVERGPFVVRVDYQNGQVEIWGQELQDLTLTLGVVLVNHNRSSKSKYPRK